MNAIVRLIPMWLALQMIFYDINSPQLGFRPDRVTFVIIVMIFIYQVANKRVNPSKLGRLEMLMILFTIYCTISLIIGGANLDPEKAKNKWLNALFNITYYPFVTYYLVKSIEFTERRLNIVIGGICIIGVYLSATGIFEHFRISALVWPSNILDASKGIQQDRVRGPFLESVAMGRVLSVVFVCFLIKATHSIGIKGYFYGLFSALSVLSIYYTYTRGPWLGFAMILMVIMVSDNRMKQIVKKLILLIIIVAIAGIGSKLTIFEGSLFSQRQKTVDERVISYTTAKKMGFENILWGVGFGRFEYEWDNYVQDIQGINANPEKVSHSTLMGIFSELGSIGLIMYTMILYGLMRESYIAYRKYDKLGMKSHVSISVFAIGLMYIVSGFVSDLRWSAMQNNLVYIFFGISSSLLGQQTAVQARSNIENNK